MKKNIVSLAMLAVTAAWLVSCSGETSIYTIAPFTPSPQTTLSPQSGDVTPAASCFTSTFKQKADTQSKIDTLLVLDVSGSMNGFRNVLASQFDVFYSKILASKPNLDFRVGVLLAWSTVGAKYWSGKLYNAPVNSCSPSPVLKGVGKTDWDNVVKTQLDCILGKSMDPASAKYDPSTSEEAVMNAVIQSDGTHVPNAEGEAPFISVKNLLSGDLYTQAKANGFFRADAALSVIFASDENEICALRPDTTLERQLAWTTDGPTDTEYDFLKRNGSACVGASSEAIYSSLLSKTASGRLSVGAIARTARLTSTGSYYPHYGLGFFGDSTIGYKGIVDYAGENGFAANLQSTPESVAAALAGIGEKANNTLNKITQFPMPAEASQVTAVKIGTQSLPFNFDPKAHLLTLSSANAGADGDDLNVHWCK
jgi:hypothetical protein